MMDFDSFKNLIQGTNGLKADDGRAFAALTAQQKEDQIATWYNQHSSSGGSWLPDGVSPP